MKDLDEQIEVKDKIFEVILSCTEKEQLLTLRNGLILLVEIMTM